MFGVSRDSMILLDNRIENWSKVLVGVPVPGINSTMLVWKLNRDLNCFPESEATRLSLDVPQGRPDLSRHIFLHQGLLGPDAGEIFRSSLQVMGWGRATHQRVNSEQMTG